MLFIIKIIKWSFVTCDISSSRFYTHHWSYVTFSRKQNAEIEREREIGRERAEMLNARFIQKNVEKEKKPKQLEDVYIFVKRQRISKRKKEKQRCIELCGNPLPPPIKAIPKMVKITWSNIWIPVQRSCHKKCSHSSIWKF